MSVVQYGLIVSISLTLTTAIVVALFTTLKRVVKTLGIGSEYSVKYDVNRNTINAPTEKSLL
jgi:hypothetical protein